jgi:purine-nucleoside phosphorylase
MSFETLTAAKSVIEQATGRAQHELALVLGSGLSGFSSGLPDAIEVPYEDIPGFPVPKVEGHARSLFSARIGAANVLVLAGRVHLYEGWELDEVVFGVRTAIMCGCRTVVLTNAAGATSDNMQPGELVLIEDHINLTGYNPLMGDNDERLGPRFPDMTHVYDPGLRQLASDTAQGLGMELKQGVYAWFTGPSYETPAEIRMVAGMGGDLAGMSTVPEAIAARHMGARVLGISLVTNLAAGLSSEALSHDEVTDIGAQAKPRFTRLLNALLPKLAA